MKSRAAVREVRDQSVAVINLQHCDGKAAVFFQPAGNLAKRRVLEGARSGAIKYSAQLTDEKALIAGF